MSTWFKAWFDYGRCAGVAKALFDDDKSEGGAPARGPIRRQTEGQIVPDEKRPDEAAKRLDPTGAADRRREAR
jgi:hypothetical protein